MKKRTTQKQKHEKLVTSKESTVLSRFDEVILQIKQDILHVNTLIRAIY